MVPAQVGVNAHREGYAVHPVQHQCVGGHLHHHMGAARVGHLPQQLLQLEGLRRGALGVQHPVADHILYRADQAHLGPGLLFQNALDEVGAGGLAAGTGDADHGHLPCGVIKAIAAHHCQRPAAVRHPDEGRAVLRRALAQHAGSALLPRHGNIFMSVRLRAGDGDEQIARFHQPRVVPYLPDVAIQLGVCFQNIQPVQQLTQLHHQLSFASVRNGIHTILPHFVRGQKGTVCSVGRKTCGVSPSRTCRPAAR